jgi:hypothetical protein
MSINSKFLRIAFFVATLVSTVLASGASDQW